MVVERQTVGAGHDGISPGTAGDLDLARGDVHSQDLPSQGSQSGDMGSPSAAKVETRLPVPDAEYLSDQLVSGFSERTTHSALNVGVVPVGELVIARAK
nr:hypothetical protein [Kitasatospora azatica]